MYRANLSFAQLNEYLTFLSANGFIKQANEVSSGRGIYIVTEKGFDFLRRHSELIELLKS